MLGIYKKDGQRYSDLRWSFLKKVNRLDERAAAFWKHEEKRVYRLFNEDSNVWLTRHPRELIQPLADKLEAELYSGPDYQELYDKVVLTSSPLLVADAYPAR